MMVLLCLILHQESCLATPPSSLLLLLCLKARDRVPILIIAKDRAKADSLVWRSDDTYVSLSLSLSLFLSRSTSDTFAPSSRHFKQKVALRCVSFDWKYFKRGPQSDGWATNGGARRILDNHACGVTKLSVFLRFLDYTRVAKPKFLSTPSQFSVRWRTNFTTPPFQTWT